MARERRCPVGRASPPPASGCRFRAARDPLPPPLRRARSPCSSPGALSACGKHQSTGARSARPRPRASTSTSRTSSTRSRSRASSTRPTSRTSRTSLGIPEEQRELKPDEVWFAVGLRVQNETGEALLPSDDIEIEDTQDEIFEPIELGTENVFAYRSEDAIPPRETYPLLDSPGYDTPARSALLLFKLTLTALNNRPLELKIEGRKAPQQTGIVDLDV